MTAPSDLQRAMTPRLNRYIPHTPHAKQAAFLLLPQLEALFGGAAGGGKSDALLMAALQYFDVPGYAALILRTTKQSLTLPGGLIPRSHEWLANTGARWRASENTWYSPEGASLTFGYLRSEDDRYRYASSEYQFIGFEELTEFKRAEDYRFVFSRVRRTVDNVALSRVPRRIRATTNPIGPGYAWVKERFVDVPATAKRIFLPSTIEDNPSLSAEEYDETLAELPPIIRAKLRNGDWSAVEKGEFFDRTLINIATPPRDMVKEVRFWDLAATPVSPRNTDPDWTCGIRLGVDEHGRWWILGVELLREAPTGVEQAVLTTANLDGRGIYHRMFQDPAQAGKAQITNYAKLLRGFDFAGVPISGNLMTLVAGISAQAGAGNLYMSPTVGHAAGELLDQLEGFPYAGHDDAVAALSGGFNFLVDARVKRSRTRPLPKRVM